MASYQENLAKGYASIIQAEMERQGISAVEILKYLCSEPDFPYNELFAILYGQKYGAQEVYANFAAALGMTYEELFPEGGKIEQRFLRCGKYGIDTLTCRRGSQFCKNVTELWLEMNPANKIDSSFFAKLGTTEHKFYLVNLGQVPLTSDLIMSAAGLFNASDCPERVSMPTREVTDYPRAAIMPNGDVDVAAFAYNFRMVMHIRLWEGKHFCQMTGRTRKYMLDLMSKKVCPTLGQAQELAEQLGLQKYHLTGEVKVDREGHREPDFVRFPVESVEKDSMWRGQRLASAIKGALMSKGFVRGGTAADRTLCGAWREICPDIPLAKLWGGNLADADPERNAALKTALPHIAQCLGAGDQDFVSTKMARLEDVGRMRREILRAIECEESVQRLNIMLAMAKEESCQTDGLTRKGIGKDVK